MSQKDINKMKENELGWGWYDPEEERKRLNDSALAYSRKQGLKEGAQQAKQEMVINFYNQNVPIDIISKASGLSQEDIKKIIQDN